MTLPFDEKVKGQTGTPSLRVLTPGGSKSHLVNTLMCGLGRLWNMLKGAMEPGHGKSPLESFHFRNVIQKLWDKGIVHFVACPGLSTREQSESSFNVFVPKFGTHS